MARRKLTQQQRARIAKIQAERRERVDNKANDAINQDAEHLTGRVIVRHGQNLWVKDAQGKTIHCLFRQNLGEVVCGDHVIWQASGEDGVVVAVQERTSTLSRPDYSGRDKPIAANISQLIVVLAPEPAPTGYLLDQYLIAAQRIGVDALICLNKADQLNATECEAFQQNFAHYETLGYPIIQISAKTALGRQPLLERLSGNISILVGQSGVGKSSLTNSLIANLAIAEGKLSASTGLGKHTTSAATLYTLPTGGELIDSPGVRSFRLGKLTRETLEQGYPEIRALLGQCRFHNCAHQNEPDCAVQNALQKGIIHPERLASFLHLASQIE
jgi:ribosome biogenesis GTPase